MQSKFNFNLFQVYKDRGFRQYKLAAKTGIEATRFNRIVSGALKPTDDEKRSICRILKVAKKKIFA